MRIFPRGIKDLSIKILGPLLNPPEPNKFQDPATIVEARNMLAGAFVIYGSCIVSLYNSDGCTKSLYWILGISFAFGLAQSIERFRLTKRLHSFMEIEREKERIKTAVTQVVPSSEEKGGAVQNGDSEF